MNKITFPWKLRMRGPEVADLQDALQLLLDRGALLAGDEAARVGWGEVRTPTFCCGGD
jgi:hypothetical protein